MMMVDAESQRPDRLTMGCVLAFHTTTFREGDWQFYWRYPLDLLAQLVGSYVQYLA